MGRVIQAKGPLAYGIIDGLDVRDSPVSNYPYGGMERYRKKFLSSAVILRQVNGHSIS